LKKAHLPFDRLTALSIVEGLRCAHHSSLRRTKQYASFHMISRALHLSLFELPLWKGFITARQLEACAAKEMQRTTWEL
jgi:hypothetical protein